MKLGDRIVSVSGRPYGKDPVSFRDLFLVFEGAPGTAVDVLWRPLAGGADRISRLARTLEEPGDALVWRSARVIRRDGKSYGYARLWGMSAETALAVVDMLLDRNELAHTRPTLSSWEAIDGFLLDVRANAGGYDPGILATLLRGRWSTEDFVLKSRRGRTSAPPEYKPLPVALLVNSGTASAGEALALSFRRHKIGPIVGEKTAGMASGGADAKKLSDGSLLWLSSRAMEDADGHSYEGNGVPPDVAAADRPAAKPGEEEAVIEAAMRALEEAGNRKSGTGNR
jgi:carboxyl-terminal processing protease